MIAELPVCFFQDIFKAFLNVAVNQAEISGNILQEGGNLRFVEYEFFGTPSLNPEAGGCPDGGNSTCTVLNEHLESCFLVLVNAFQMPT
jgi:hypothetical protein